VANAQTKGNSWDTIVKSDATTIKCKILKVTDDNIEYKPKGNKPFLMISRNDVESIIYSDGSVVLIKNQKKDNNTQEINLKNIPQEREEICRSCNGNGISRVTCSICNGSGRLKCTNCNNGRVLNWVIVLGGKAHWENQVCSSCNGATQLSCYYCNGAGMISTTCIACEGKGKILLNK
jgi:DnaJ-class molecular chaperone